MKNGFQLLRVDLLVLASDVKSRYSQALEISLLEVLPLHQGLVYNANSHIEGLWPHLELVVKLSEPIHQVLAVLIRDFRLEAPVSEEVAWVHVSELLISHILHDFRDKLNDSLWVPDLQDIIEVQLGLVLLQPIFPPLVHLSDDLGQHLLVEFRFGKLQLRSCRHIGGDGSRSYQGLWWLDLLDYLVDDHGLLLVDLLVSMGLQLLLGQLIVLDRVLVALSTLGLTLLRAMNCLVHDAHVGIVQGRAVALAGIVTRAVLHLGVL